MSRRLALAATIPLLALVLVATPATDAAAAPLVVGTVPTPTSLTVFDAGSGPRLFVASFGTGQVVSLPILDGGALGPPTPYAGGFSSPLGVAFAPDGTLFVADSHPSARPDRTTAGRVWAVPPGGDATGPARVVVDELPNGRHNTNGLAVHRNRLFITNGNSTDDGVEGGEPEEGLSGTLISVPVTARDLMIGPPGTRLPRAVTVEARGMRNLFDVAFQPRTDDAWIPTNGPDAQDPWGEDLLHRVPTRWAVRDFGFPGCVHRAGPDGPLDPIAQQNANPDVTDRCDGTETPPTMTLGLHVSADGLAFGPEAGWGGDLYVTEFGNFNGDQVVGHKVVRVPFDGGRPTGPPEDVLTAATPLDLTFGPAGTGMYVADFGTGQILLVTPG